MSGTTFFQRPRRWAAHGLLALLMGVPAHAQTPPPSPSPLDDIGKTMDRYATPAARHAPASSSSASTAARATPVRERAKKPVKPALPVASPPASKAATKVPTNVPTNVPTKPVARPAPVAPIAPPPVTVRHPVAPPVGHKSAPAPVVVAVAVPRHAPSIPSPRKASPTVMPAHAATTPSPVALPPPVVAPDASAPLANTSSPPAPPGPPWYLNRWTWIGGGIAIVLLLIEIIGRRHNYRSRRGL